MYNSSCGYGCGAAYTSLAMSASYTDLSSQNPMNGLYFTHIQIP